MVYLSKAIASDRHVVINVAGQRFETLVSTLERFPNTRLSSLANLREKDANYDSSSGEFFFDRHPGVFSSILQYYRTEELHLDKNLCGNVVKCEFDFWGMMEQDIEPCCWTIFSTAQECKGTLAAIDNMFLSDYEEITAWNEKDSEWVRFRKKVWIFLEDPSSSLSAKMYVMVSMLVVVLSIITFILETWNFLREPIAGVNYTVSVGNCNVCCGQYISSEIQPGALIIDLDLTEPIALLQYANYAWFGFFLAEFLIHLFFAPSLKIFFQSIFNLIDIICIVTHLTSIILLPIESKSSYKTLVRTVHGLRIARVLRIFKLVKHYNAFRILIYTIRMSVHELMLMIVFLLIGAVIFGSIIYVVEKQNFGNIPDGVWWALVTMTTVGYGDFVPRETGGYLVGCVCVIFGVLTIAFTVPIVVNNFALYYTHAQARNKKPKSYWRHKRIALSQAVDNKSREKADLNDLNVYGNHNLKSDAYQEKQVFVQKVLTSDNIDTVGNTHHLIYHQYKENQAEFNVMPHIETPESKTLESKKHEEHTRQLLVSMQKAEDQHQSEQRRQGELVKVRKTALEERKKRQLVATKKNRDDNSFIISKSEKRRRKKSTIATVEDGENQPNNGVLSIDFESTVKNVRSKES